MNPEQTIAKLRHALQEIGTLVEGRADVEDRPDGDGVRPNLEARIQTLVDGALE